MLELFEAPIGVWLWLGLVGVKSVWWLLTVVSVRGYRDEYLRWSQYPAVTGKEVMNMKSNIGHQTGPGPRRERQVKLDTDNLLLWQGRPTRDEEMVNVGFN